MCFVRGRSKGREKGMLCCSPWGWMCSRPVNCAPWLGCSVVESWPETGLSLSEVTRCYNSHILSVGRRTMLLLPPWFGPQLTFWPINLPWTRSQRITSHWKFGVYQGFDITRADWTHGSPCSYEKLLWNCPCESQWFYQTQWGTTLLQTHLTDEFSTRRTY